MSNELHDEQHIGDGVYVAHDGYNIILSANEAVSRVPFERRVHLEPQVFEQLMNYRKALIARVAATAEQEEKTP